MSSIGPEDKFNPKDPLAPRSVRSEANVRSSLTLSRSNIISFVAGIGVSAIIVFVFFILIPKLSQSTVTQPAVSESTSAIAQPGGDKTTPEESEVLLRKFMQWQQKK
jgi:hypothetical protein